MGRKATKAEVTQRVEELAEMVIKGYSQRELMRHVTDSWGLSAEQASRYVRKGRDLVIEDAGQLDRKDMLAAKIQMLEQIARDCAVSGRENNAIGAIRLLAELVGAFPK
jgi:hypothetical protein